MSCVILVGCASAGTPVVSSIPASKTSCATGVKGYTPGKITYRTKNTFLISVKLKFDAGEGTELRLKLDPKKGSEDSIVSIVGKKGTLPDGTSTPFGWLNKSGKASDFRKDTMVLCVPPKIPVGTVYKFDVVVAGIGTIKAEIDPRVDVTW